MDNTHENDVANVMDETKNIDNVVDEIMRASLDEAVDANSETENDVATNQDVAAEESDIEEMEVDDAEMLCDEENSETSAEMSTAKAKGKKFAIATGVGIGVALIGVGLLVNKRSTRLAYHIAKSII